MAKIILTGGGTGGHIFPLITVARKIKIFNKNVQVIYLGPKSEFENIFLQGEEIKIRNIFSGKLRRYFSIWNFIDVFKIPIGLIQAFIYLFFKAPDVIFSKGGYGSFPVVISGWLLRIPVIIHESDSVPGLSNRILAKFARRILTSFPRTPYFPLNKTVQTGNPIRVNLLKGSREEAINIFGLHQDRPVILILGGSQGAQRINEKILSMLPELIQHFEVIHQVGQNNFDSYKKAVMANYPEELLRYYHIMPFLREKILADAYAVADFIVSRSGSGSIFEIAAVGKPSILIPLPESAQNHQVENAYQYARTGAAVVIEERNFTPHLFLEKIKFILNNPEIYKKMSQAAKNFAQTDASERIARIILNEV